MPAATPLGRETSPCDAVIRDTDIDNLPLLWLYNDGGGAEDANSHPLEDVPTWVRQFLNEGHKTRGNKLGTT